MTSGYRCYFAPVRPRFSPRRCFGALVILLWMVLGSRPADAGNIFDDDWSPPVRREPAPAAPLTRPAPGVPATPKPEVSPTAPAPPARRPIPAKGDSARSRRLMEQIFSAELADSSPQGRQTLATKLLAEESKYDANPADQFVLLSGAIEAAKEGGDLPECFGAADRLASVFAVEGLDVKADAALRMPRAAYAVNAVRNVSAALEVLDQLASAEDFSTAARLGFVLQPIADSDSALGREVQQRRKEIEQMRVAQAKVVTQVERLKKSPDDPAANLAVGSYYCFENGDWGRGLQLLAKGSDAKLKELATTELANPNAPDALVRLGDGWWDFAAKQPEPTRDRICLHAAELYSRAVDGVAGLQRVLVEKRIVEASSLEQVHHSASKEFTNTIGMRFTRIEPGEFLMGSPDSEVGRDKNETQHKVKLTKPFLIGIHHVTRGQFAAFVKGAAYRTDAEKDGWAYAYFDEINFGKVNGASWEKPGFVQTDDHPVVEVSWNDATAFCKWLSAKEGKNYRLPTEAEWEYACRAGANTAYFWGDNPDGGLGFANCADLTAKEKFSAWNPVFKWRDGFVFTSPVGSFKPNPWGLYDIIGNAWEWCSDFYGPYPDGDAVDPTGPAQGDANSSRVLRGGSWSDLPRLCRAAFRLSYSPDNRSYRIGFRVCLDF